MDLRILIVDDQAHMTSILISQLRHMGFEKMLIAHTLREARQVYLDRSPDLILCDEKLPDGEALKFCQTIRAREDKQIEHMKEQMGTMGGMAMAGGMSFPDPGAMGAMDISDDIRCKFILVSALPTLGLVEKCKSSGVDAIMSKPISQRDLETRLNHLFSK